MKTTKLLTVLLLYVATAFVTKVNAQEKQNDATWEETIDFIKKYSYLIEDVKYFDNPDVTIDDEYIYLSSSGYAYYSSSSTYNGEFYTTEIKINNTIKLPIENIRKLEDYWENKDVLYLVENVYISADLKKDKSASYNDKDYPETYEKYQNSWDEFKLYFNESSSNYKEDSNRLRKAFYHLAYLANEKRKKEKEQRRKESGDKF